MRISKHLYRAVGRLVRGELVRIGPDILYQRPFFHKGERVMAVTDYVYTTTLSYVMDLKGVSLVIDVGANTGQFGDLLRKSGYEGQITSFEPVREAFEALSTKIHGDSKWLAVNVALGDADDVGNINVSFGTNFSSMLEVGDFGAGAFEYKDSLAVSHAETVEVRRLDTVWTEIEPLRKEGAVLLELDTQGYDIKVMEGLGDVLDDITVIQTEMSVTPLYVGMPSMMDSMRYFMDKGFVPSHITPVVRDHDFGAVEFDCILVRREGGEPYNMC